MMTSRPTNHDWRCRSGRERHLQLVDLENLLGSTVLERSESIRQVPDQTFQHFSTWYVANFCRDGDQIWAAADDYIPLHALPQPA